MKPEEISKQKDILHQISQASDAIRRKHRMLKLGKDTAEKAMDDMFKPIVTPLQSLVESSKQPKYVKIENITKDESTAKKLKYDSSYAETSNYNSLISEDPTLDDARLPIAPTSSSTPAKPYSLLNDYLGRSGPKTPKNTDKRYGVRTKNGEMFMGDSQIFFTDGKVSVKGKDYPITHGLLELLFRKAPNDAIVTQDDKTKYLDIIQRTNTHRKKYDPNNEIYLDQTVKFKNYIADFINKSGRGLPKFMIAKKRRVPMDYVYWDDPNELVDRLRLLMASQAAGNPSHTNEIMSIIEELREAGIIY